MSIVAIAGIIAISAPAAANAIEGDEEYTPTIPESATLAGSVAYGECQRDVPWINYNVTLTDPDEQATSDTATLILTDGANTAEIPLGTLVGNSLSGRILWPGASVDGSGNPTGWPGWAFVNGEWVETSGNFAWTRGAISAKIRVNPDLVVALSYPPATPQCAAAPPQGSGGGGAASEAPGLAVTGEDVPIIAVAVGAALLVAGGAAVMLRRRTTRS
ncbi:LPXTG cell wall anchor domain-containing protein [Microbacterium sp. Root166]|uniref:LPXTG cell wall anchor domain-containing protein n=1 Tax=Microbacterium sp. Root166 TaxID=1736478 RepID=UPI000AA29690|nr:LPXTG cell wall anchor domain-containing protein [Microbacterium sp. Root166]